MSGPEISVREQVRLRKQLIKNNVLSEQWANENDSNISKMEKMERQVQRKYRNSIWQ